MPNKRDHKERFAGGIALLRLVRGARDRLHYIVRDVAADEVEAPFYEASLTQLNSLLIAKKPSDVLQAIDGMPPMVPCSSFEGSERLYSLEDAKEKFPKTFTRCEASQFDAELFIESATGVRANRVSSDAVVSQYGSDGSRVVDEMGLGEGRLIAVEPVVDWFTLRNILSLTARLLGRIRGEEGDAPILEESGFEFRNNGFYKADTWLIPLKYSSFEDAKYSLSVAYDHSAATRLDPLFNAITEWRKVSVKQPYLNWVPGVDEQSVRVLPCEEHGRGGCDIMLAAQSSAMEDFRKVFGPNRLTPEQKLTYLLVKDEGPQMEMAKRIVLSFVEAFQGMEDGIVKGKGATPRFLGWELSQKEIFSNLNAPAVVCRSFASALMCALVYRSSHRITICSMCGSAAISNARGTKKEYCSDACRVRGSRKKRQGKRKGGSDD